MEGREDDVEEEACVWQWREGRKEDRLINHRIEEEKTSYQTFGLG